MSSSHAYDMGMTGYILYERNNRYRSLRERIKPMRVERSLPKQNEINEMKRWKPVSGD